MIGHKIMTRSQSQSNRGNEDPDESENYDEHHNEGMVRDHDTATSGNDQTMRRPPAAETAETVLDKEIRLAELRLRERELEIELKLLDRTRSYAQSTSGQTDAMCDIDKYARLIRQSVPAVPKDKSEIASYFAHIEMAFQRFQVPESIKGAVIFPLLGELAYDLSAAKDDGSPRTFNEIKEWVLENCRITPEKQRKCWDQAFKKPDESWTQLASRLSRMWNQYLKSRGTTTMAEMNELILCDKLKSLMSPQQKSYVLLKEGTEWKRSKDIAALAEAFSQSQEIEEQDSRGNWKRDRVVRQERGYGKPFKNAMGDGTPYVPLRKNTPDTSGSGNIREYGGEKPRLQAKTLTCYLCGGKGHFARACPQSTNCKGKTLIEARGNSVQIEDCPSEPEEEVQILAARVEFPVTSGCMKTPRILDELRYLHLKCGEVTMKGIIDTGAEISVIREGLISLADHQSTGQIKLISAFGDSEIAKLAIINMKIDDGQHSDVPVTCAVSSKLSNDMLICPTAYAALKGKIVHPDFDSRKWDLLVDEQKAEEDQESEVEAFLPKGSPMVNILQSGKCSDDTENASREEFIRMQIDDLSLGRSWEFAQERLRGYDVVKNVLMHYDVICGEKVTQLVLPECKRELVLKMGHDIPLSGHLGEKKTKERIKYVFYWPDINTDVKRYCESCLICQTRRSLTYRDRVPIHPIARPENPFEVWTLDCVGPLEPKSRRGHKYIICAIDLCTRWAEAIPTKNITAKTTCDVLMEIFCRTGFPETLCTDQGTNFTAELTARFEETLGVSPRFSTPGHPESVGAVERWNRTLKEMLAKNIQEYGNQWDIHLPYLLFAYREVPHETTGMSPFQLVYGRLPAGPMKLIKELWCGDSKLLTTASKSVEEYVENLKERIRSAHDLADKVSSTKQRMYADRYNLRARDKHFEIGDQVLLLIPSSTHKLLKKWGGPYTIVEKTRPYTYHVKLDDGSIREIHANKIRPFVARVEHVGVLFEEDVDFGEIECAPTERKPKLAAAALEMVIESQDALSEKQRADLQDVLFEYSEVFRQTPGSANVEGHNVRVTDDHKPKRLRPYRVPVALQKEVERQIDELLALGLIEPSNSEWAHPVVCVAKKDGTVRLCVDFRHLNSFTVADAYPMKNPNELLFKVGAANFITVMDLTKGYWQIPMKEEAKPYTAFVTHSGHYQWKVLPFGMKNAGSTFQKSMDRLLAPHSAFCHSYIDDVAVFSKTWAEHVTHLRKVFSTIQSAGLTVNLQKCEFAKQKVKFLGHVIGSGQHAPDPQKVDTIQKVARPTTKKELRSFLGLCGYYRDYISKYASLVLPLTELTKKRVPNVIPWGAKEESSFLSLKQELLEVPNLYTPDFKRPFQLFTDASAEAVGACLSQCDEQGKEHPIAFYSKKLTLTQRRWSTIEREAYSVIAALKRFDTWIFGSCIQVVSDHNPLTYLTSGTPQGAKLARWALALQRYNLTLSYRKGSQHGNADALSRLRLEDVDEEGSRDENNKL